MFWGNGDSSKLVNEEQETLKHIRRLVETGHLVALTPEQTAIALHAINFYASVRSASSLLVAARNVLVFIGAILGMWWLGQDTLVKFIQAAAKASSGT